MWSRPATETDRTSFFAIGPFLGWLSDGVVTALLSLSVAILLLLYFSDSERSIPLLRVTEFQAIAVPGDPIETVSQDLLTKLRSSNLSTNGNLMRQTDTPLLLRFEIQVPNSNGGLVIELERIRARTARLWLVSPMQEGDSNLTVLLTETPIERNGRGLAFAVDRNGRKAFELIFYVQADAPARTSLLVWSANRYPAILSEFDGTGGVLYGSLLALGLFAAVIAFLNKDRTFWIFSGVALTSLRVAAVNGGWDAYWLGINNVSLYLYLGLQLTLVAHAILVIELFREIFHPYLGPVKERTLSCLQVALFSSSILALFAPLPVFLTVFWSLAGIGMTTLLVSTALVCLKNPSTTAYLYAASWAATFGGLFAEITMASGAVTKSSFPLNTRTGAILSVMLLAATLAERLRTERTARLAAQLQTVAAMGQFRDTYNSVPIGLFSLNADGLFTSVNPTFKQMFGERLRFVGQKDLRWDSLFLEDYQNKLKENLDTGKNAEIELSLIAQSDRWFRVHAYRKDSLIEGSIEDITSRRQFREQLQRQADHDSLTDLLNRRGLDLCLVKQITEVKLNTPSCLAFMDMDRFKLVNDMFGHASGDSVLLEIANRLRSASPADAELARVGGDEFVLLFKNCPSAEAKSICARIVSEVNERPFSVGEKQFSVVASIGLIALTGTMTPSFAVSAADRACADAKRQGGNRVVVYGETDRELQNHVAEMDMVSKIHSSLPVDRMRMVLQPIVSLQAPFASLSYESLLRVIDDDGRLGPPAALIQAAERHGFISRLDRWVLNTMVDWLNAHPEHRERLNYCAINLSGASLNDERFLADVLAIVRANPEAAKRMCFEITETVALYDLKNTCRFVDAVRGFGSKVALDDFGAGYTSFNYLKSLQADLVKIDGTFVKTLDTDRSNYAITRTIVDLTHEMGMSCVAEWAENARVVEMLAQMGVDYGQGWALAKPLPMDSLLAVRNSGELVTDLEVINILQKDREPVFRLPTRQILHADSVRNNSAR